MDRYELLKKMDEYWDGFDVDTIPEKFHSDREVMYKAISME